MTAAKYQSTSVSQLDPLAEQALVAARLEQRKRQEAISQALQQQQLSKKIKVRQGRK